MAAKEIEVGDTVKLKSDTKGEPQLLSVFAVADGMAQVRWFDLHKSLQREEVPVGCLEKAAPPPTTGQAVPPLTK